MQEIQGAARQRTRSRPPLRSDPRRPADRRERAFAILDSTERHSASEDERLAELVREAQRGEPLAFADLYIALFDRVHRWLQVALKDREEAIDAAQQVFLRAFEALPRYSEQEGFRPWVFAIARNLAYDRLRAAARSTHAVDPAVLAEQRESEAPPAEEGIESLVADLPPLQRRVLTLRFVSDMDAADIGDVLDMTADAVRHAQHRALRSLARTMGRSEVAAAVG
jgi:RNA polymerase sigma-70 factor (ECF subfamily)